MEDYSYMENDRYQRLRARTRSTLTALNKTRSIDVSGHFERLLKEFSAGERLVLYVLTALLGLSAFLLLIGASAGVSVVVPAPGGSLTEGEVGPARFVNPILTLSQADQDLTELVYSGLVRRMPDGSIVPDLASSYEISPDGKTYTFHLRPDATFQDGSRVTAADVLYTVSLAQDPSINSPYRADWDGVVASSPDPETVVFTLPHAYAPFIGNATLGILPKHLWQNITAEEFPFSPLNTHPVGSGPYKVARISTDSAGAPTRYDLVPFSGYTRGAPYLSEISLVIYSSADEILQDYNAGRIDAISGISPENLKNIRKGGALAAETLPRVFGIFFNQSHNTQLGDSAVREALNAAVDKQALVNQVLDGFGAPLQGPIPPGMLGTQTPGTPGAFPANSATSSTPDPSYVANAKTILQQGGWKFENGAWTKNKETLSLSIATADAPELVATANAVADDWKAVGVQVSVQVYPLSELNTTVIRPREYDALLFGEVVGPELDLYAFWHSSQRNDPGLNVALYTNSSADDLLTQARATSDTRVRDKLYEQFSAQVEKDMPAVFLYAPDFLYVVPKDLQGVSLGALESPADRFDNVYQWYEQTESVWSIFAPQTNTDAIY